MIPFGLEALMTVSLPIQRRASKCFVPGASAIYLFNEGAGTSLLDHSGNGYHGTLGTTTAAPTWATEGLAFDGGDKVDLVPANFATAFETAMTVIAVVNPTGATTGGIIEVGRSAGSLTLGLRVVANQGYFYAGTTAAHASTLAGALPAATWTDFAYTYVWGGNAVGYINGTQNASAAIVQTYAAPANYSTLIGGFAGFMITGGLAALLLYPFAMTPAQIAQTHAALKTLLAPRGIALA